MMMKSRPAGRQQRMTVISATRRCDGGFEIGLPDSSHGYSVASPVLEENGHRSYHQRDHQDQKSSR